MKILFDATPMVASKTGIAYYTERLVTEMAKAHPEAEFVGFYFNFLGKRDASHLPKLPNLRYQNTSVIPSKVVFQLRRFGIEFPIECMALTRADFILYANFLGYPSIFKTPSAMVIHDLTYLDLPDYVSGKLKSDLTRFVPKQIKRSALLLTVSEFSKRRIQQAYHPSQDILVTPVPPDAPVTHTETEREKVLKKAGIVKPYILFVGTIEPRKNITQLVKTYTALPQKLRDQYSLVIAGRIGWKCADIVTALNDAKKSGFDVIHLGYVSDSLREVLYQSASLFTTASHYEGFGMPILEAMSYGVPCAISNIPVFHEVAGTSALYFDQEDVNSISRALMSLLSDEAKRKKYAKLSKTRVKAFDWRKIADTTYAKIAETVQKQQK